VAQPAIAWDGKMPDCRSSALLLLPIPCLLQGEEDYHLLEIIIEEKILNA
jgi:hypothetical protein